ncbi:3503_t:CDS:2, partial [Acaulospora colombiana]
MAQSLSVIMKLYEGNLLKEQWTGLLVIFSKAGAEIGRIGSISTGADIIQNGTWDEDWSIAGGEPVDNAPATSNAG